MNAARGRDKQPQFTGVNALTCSKPSRRRRERWGWVQTRQTTFMCSRPLNCSHYPPLETVILMQIQQQPARAKKLVLHQASQPPPRDLKAAPHSRSNANSNKFKSPQIQQQLARAKEVGADGINFDLEAPIAVRRQAAHAFSQLQL